MEVSLLLPIMSSCVWLVLESMRDGRFRGSPYVVLGASTLVRADMVVPLGALALFLSATDTARWRRHVAWASAALVFFMGLQTILRMWYFGDLLPNTYYLK